MARSASEIPHRWVATDGDVVAVAEEVSAHDTYAIDTEFHRERSYYPHLALVQIAWPSNLVLIDPLAADVRGLAPLFMGPGTAIMHAAAQDLEVLELACGVVPPKLFDTQVAAGFVGHSSPSLSTLVDKVLGERLPKGDRLTDWLDRPLGDGQRRYAAADVYYLHALHRHLNERLDDAGRADWATAECEELRSRPRSRQDPETAWLRIKEARHLRGSARGIAKEIAAWRERTAADGDQPVRFVLSDLALVGLAQQAPHRAEDLRRIRGIDPRHLRNGAAAEILDAIKRGERLPNNELTAPDASRNGLDRALRPAVTLVSAWVSQLARDEGLDTALLATRNDIVAFLRGDKDGRLSDGWRHELLGEPIRALVEGRAALAFDGEGGLVLEKRT